MNKDKQHIRERVWKELMDAGAGAFPFPLEGRIPNFRGSGSAAELLCEQDFWKKSKVLKANPDSPQKRVREIALRDGKKIFMAVPRLRDENPFRELDPGRIDDIKKAISISGSMDAGLPVSVEDLPEIDLIIAGSVAVHRDGRRVGKGGGYSDLEFALAKHYGKITEKTLIVTTVHQIQIVDDDIPVEPHDIPLDYIVTPDEVIRTDTVYRRPEGIIPEMITDKYREGIPCLAGFTG